MASDSVSVILHYVQNDNMNQDLTLRKDLRVQACPVCKCSMGDMPGSRDAYCPNCGYKDPCCE